MTGLEEYAKAAADARRAAEKTADSVRYWTRLATIAVVASAVIATIAIVAGIFKN